MFCACCCACCAFQFVAESIISVDSALDVIVIFWNFDSAITNTGDCVVFYDSDNFHFFSFLLFMFISVKAYLCAHDPGVIKLNFGHVIFMCFVMM